MLTVLLILAPFPVISTYVLIQSAPYMNQQKLCRLTDYIGCEPFLLNQYALPCILFKFIRLVGLAYVEYLLIRQFLSGTTVYSNVLQLSIRCVAACAIYLFINIILELNNR